MSDRNDMYSVAGCVKKSSDKSESGPVMECAANFPMSGGGHLTSDLDCEGVILDLRIPDFRFVIQMTLFSKEIPARWIS